MANEEEAAAVSTFLCCSLIGVGLLVGGALWLDSMPNGGCPCDSVHCCAQSETCPRYAPCLCQTVGPEPSNDTCAPKKGRDESDKAGAISMIVTGAVSSSTLAFLLALLAIFLVVGLLMLIGMGFLKMFGAVGKYCSRPSIETQIKEVETTNVQLDAEPTQS